jgi:RimJ/RimL family protein N-acetyltransferase
MISSRFLSTDEHHKFGWWLKGLNAEDRRMYFGMSVSDEYIDQLISRITQAPDNHKFLVSYNCTGWLGVLHIARISDDAIEFGISVYEEYRNFGIGSDLLKEGIVWARNRGYQQLYLHCVKWNTAMAHLATKHDLAMRHEDGDIDVMSQLAPPSWYSLQQETADVNRRIFHLWLNQTFFNYQESCA